MAISLDVLSDFQMVKFLNTLPDTLVLDLVDANGAVPTASEYQPQTVTLGTIVVEGGKSKRKNTTAARWADTLSNWGTPYAVKISDNLGNLIAYRSYSILSGTMPIGDVTEYANIAIGQIVFG